MGSNYFNRQYPIVIYDMDGMEVERQDLKEKDRLNFR